MYVYVIRNSATGKVYIGQHKGDNLKKYLQTKLSDAAKYRGGSSHLFASMRKHPKEVWSIEPLMDGIETKEELNHLEKLLIALYDTQNPEVGYNICKGGEGYTGPFTDEMKAAWCAGNKRYWEERKQDLTGQPFNRLTVLSEAESKTSKRGWKTRRVWNCVCTCGNLVTVSTDKLKNGGVQSCGCLHIERQKARWDSLVGQTFGKLTVEAEADRYRSQRRWHCICECGVRTVVRTNSLRSGNTKSCGCHN